MTHDATNLTVSQNVGSQKHEYAKAQLLFFEAGMGDVYCHILIPLVGFLFFIFLKCRP